MPGHAMMAWGGGGSERAAPLIRKLEVSGQPPVPAALPPVPFEYEGGWAPEFCLTWGGRNTD